MITTDFKCGEEKYSDKTNVLKDNQNHLESIKDKAKYNNNNNNRDGTDSINDNCSSCLIDTHSTTKMSTNNIIKVNMLNARPNKKFN